MPKKSDFGWFSQARYRAIVAAAIALVSIGTAVFVNDAYNDESEKVTWPTIAATENEVRVDKHSHSCGENCSENRYHVEVKYRYHPGFTTDWRVVEHEKRQNSAEYIAAIIGSRIHGPNPLTRTVRYDPQNPSRSSFRMSIGSRFSWISAPIGFASSAFIWFIVEYIGIAARRRQSDT